MIQLKRGSSGLLVLIVIVLAVLVLQPLTGTTSAQSILLGVIAGLLAILVLAPASRSVEYKVVPAETVDQSLLDQLGQDGWQLISADAMKLNYVFKR